MTLGLLHFLPFGTGKVVENSPLADASYNVYDSPVSMYAMVAAAFVFVISIFLFRNRKVQRLVVTLGLFCAGILIGFVAMNYFSEKEIFSAANDYKFSLGMALPIVAVILATLAIRGIAKDENLVRSSDRLR